MAKRKSDPERQEFWRLAIQLHQESGLSVREFCKREQLQEPSFYMWRCKLRSLEAANPKDGQGESSARRGQGDTVLGRKERIAASYRNAAVQGTSDSTSCVFVPVRMSSEGLAGGRERIEIVVAGSRVVRVPDQFDRQTLREVLCVLEGEAC